MGCYSAINIWESSLCCPHSRPTVPSPVPKSSLRLVFVYVVSKLGQLKKKTLRRCDFFLSAQSLIKLHWLHMSSPHLTSKYLKSVRVWENGHCHPPSWWLIKDTVPSICRSPEGDPRVINSELEPGACFPGASGMLCAWSWKPRHLRAAPAGPLLTSRERSLEPVRASCPP